MMNESTVERNALGAAVHQKERRGVAVSIQSLTKRYGEHEVPSDLVLDVEPGQFVDIVGRSDCGKSTLLRLVAGLDAPSGGRVGFRNGAAAAAPEIRILFQEARLSPWKRVLANVALGLPRLLLLDEPLGALDALTRIEMQRLIESVWRDRAFTGLLVTHDVDEAVVLADRVVLIEDGRIVLDEPVDLPRPRVRDSAQFAAQANRVLRRVLQRPQAPGVVRTAAQREPAFQQGMFDARFTC